MNRQFLLLFSTAGLGLAVAGCNTTQERVGGAGVGAATGAVVGGPVGAVAGGVVGAAAGPTVARETGITQPRRVAKKRVKRTTTTQTPG